MTYSRTTAWLEIHRLRGEIGLDPNWTTLVGSCLIADEGRDVDILAMNVKDSILEEAGFTCESDDTYEDLFTSWRRGDINLLLTYSRDYYIAEMAAAVSACTLLREGPFDLNDRHDRVRFHGFVRDAMSDTVSAESPIW